MQIAGTCLLSSKAWICCVAQACRGYNCHELDGFTPVLAIHPMPRTYMHGRILSQSIHAANVHCKNKAEEEDEAPAVRIGPIFDSLFNWNKEQSVG
jgi:hypothetical protein